MSLEQANESDLAEFEFLREFFLEYLNHRSIGDGGRVKDAAEAGNLFAVFIDMFMRKRSPSWFLVQSNREREESVARFDRMVREGAERVERRRRLRLFIRETRRGTGNES